MSASGSSYTSSAAGGRARAHAVGRSRHSLPERRRRMPIIDVADEPPEKLQGHWQRHALTRFLWFRVLRPLMLIGLWFAVAFYVWIQISGVSRTPVFWHSLEVAGLGLLTMLSFTLAALLLRSHAHKQVPRHIRIASAHELARYARLPASELIDFQHRSSLLAVEHDERGHISVVRKVGPGNTAPAELDDFALRRS